MTETLIVFVKNPIEGKVKTRLAADIGNEKALEVYRVLLAHTQKITAPLTAKKMLFYSTFIDNSDFWNKTLFEKYAQVGKSLGERMKTAFSKALSGKSKKVIIIGSDCIELETHFITTAFNQLASHDIVIGPARDGGYYLLGMKALHYDLFKNKEWSTSSVFEQTISSCKNLGLSVFELPVLSDIDTVKDLESSSIKLSNHSVNN